jgi:ABC-2 type transport system ATP-binding protein
MTFRGNTRGHGLRSGSFQQELTTDAFESVWATVSFSRGPFFGKRAQPCLYREGPQGPLVVGQKGFQDHDAVGRHEARVMIAKALSHEPRILFSTSRPRASMSN